MSQENRINFASAQQLNDTILTISGVVLGFSIAFLSREGTLEYSLLLKEAWASPWMKISGPSPWFPRMT